jgi:hypothetical protein
MPSVDQMAADFADAAVELARDFGASLDFSEQSLEHVERILGQLHDDIQGLTPVQSLDERRPTTSDLTEMSKLWGSYFGEVVRRRWGGEWSIETYPLSGRDGKSQPFSTLTLSVAGAKLFPSMKVYRRLTQGDAENLWEFYGKVREKLAAAPSGKVQ